MWSSLLVVTFTLVSAAAASAPLVVESTQNGAVARVLAASSDSGVIRQQPLVRVTGGQYAPDAGSITDDVLDGVPGLGPRRVLGISFGDELVSTAAQWSSTVELLGGGGDPVGRRLAALDDVAQTLVPTTGSSSTPDVGAAESVWVDEAAAASMGVGPGDDVLVRVTTRESATSVALTVAGVYAVAADGSVPADAEGSTVWRDLIGRLPQSTGFDSPQPPLLTDVATLERITDPIDDERPEPLGERVLWSVEAGLDPAVPTLRDLTATATAMREVPRQLPPDADVDGPLGRYLVAGGIIGVQELSASIASTAVARTRGVALSALALAGLVVLVVTVVDEARRRQERRLEAAIGLHPVQVGGLRGLEVAPQALLGGLVGLAVAWVVVTVWGPGGRTTSLGMLAAATDAATAVAVAVLVVGVVSAASAWAMARLTVSSGLAASGGPGRRIPWRTGLVVAAVATVVGVLTGGDEVRGGLEILTPLLVSAGCGAVVAGLGLALLRRVLAGPARAGSADSRGQAHDVVGQVVGKVDGAVRIDSAEPARLTPRRAGMVLAWRRLAAPGQGQDAVVVLLSAGLAMAGFVALADRSLSASVESKSAVLAGASSVVRLPSGEALALDRDATPRPVLDNPVLFDLQGRPYDLDLTPATDIDVPEGDTVVWFDRTEVAGVPQVPVHVLDTDTAAAAIDFGEGSGALVQAREALATLTAVAAQRGPRAGPDPPPPVVLVGERRGLAVGDVVEARGTFSLIRLEIVAAVRVFPGQGSVTSMLVADTDTYLPALQLDDPRYVPDGTQSPLELQTEYWSSRGAGDVAAHIRAAGLPVEEVDTAQTRRLQPGFVAAELVQDYQLAVAALLVVVAVVGLSIRADRGADRALPAAVVLRRTRLGRSGVRRALLWEQAGLVLVAVVAAALAVVLLVPLAPALLDPAPRLLPRLDVAAGPVVLGLLVVATTAAAPMLAAAVTTVLRLRGTREEVVLRDDR